MVSEKYNLKSRDTFHTATMEYYRVSLMVSDDADFDKVKGIKKTLEKMRGGKTKKPYTFQPSILSHPSLQRTYSKNP